MKNKEKMDLDDLDRANKFIEQQVQRASAQVKEWKEPEFTALQREDEEEKVTISLGLKPTTSTLNPAPLA
jgi:hypothetical protein